MKECRKCHILKDDASFSKDKRKSDGLHVYCKDCDKKRAKETYNANPNRLVKRRENSRLKRERFRSIVNSFKAQNPCVKCGESEIVSLDFHHLDSSTKEDNIGSLKFTTEAKLLDEISKCVVLCANCHRKLHAGLIKL